MTREGGPAVGGLGSQSSRTEHWVPCTSHTLPRGAVPVGWRGNIRIPVRCGGDFPGSHGSQGSSCEMCAIRAQPALITPSPRGPGATRAPQAPQATNPTSSASGYCQRWEITRQNRGDQA
eukprot:gene19866-biopygen13055